MKGASIATLREKTKMFFSNRMLSTTSSMLAGPRS